MPSSSHAFFKDQKASAIVGSNIVCVCAQQAGGPTATALSLSPSTPTSCSLHKKINCAAYFVSAQGEKYYAYGNGGGFMPVTQCFQGGKATREFLKACAVVAKAWTGGC
jgi:hypothetical protein